LWLTGKPKKAGAANEKCIKCNRKIGQKAKPIKRQKTKKKESKRKLHILSAEQNKRMTKPVSECKN